MSKKTALVVFGNRSDLKKGAKKEHFKGEILGGKTPHPTKK